MSPHLHLPAPRRGSQPLTPLHSSMVVLPIAKGLKTSFMMEGGESKESKASEQVEDEAKARRFYECVFCKRGFSTAQALGGHMNIHRKDRAKMRPAALIPPVAETPGREGSERYGSPCLNIPSLQSGYPPFSESLRDYAMYLPASSNPEANASGDGDDRPRRPQELSLFSEELHSGLGVHGGDLGAEDGEERKKDGGKEEELDLELRLGHEPEARS